MLLDPTFIRDHVDYSFGDHSGHHLPTGYMKIANNTNAEFIAKYNLIKSIRPYMTLFIDNIRLYHRKEIEYTAVEKVRADWRSNKDKKVKDFSNQDLLALCASLPDMNFVIFTAFEDTPIDKFIADRIPNNVINVYASNAIYHGGKVIAYPYGLQRQMGATDLRISIIEKHIQTGTLPVVKDVVLSPRLKRSKKPNEVIVPPNLTTNLLYCNYTAFNNPIREKLNNHFSKHKWATIQTPKPNIYYANYLREILSHKFVLCPSGNAEGCDCHREWETLYMSRVPVLEKRAYVQHIFKDYPVLWVDSFFDITEDMLNKNLYLVEQAEQLDKNKMDISIWYCDILHELNKQYNINDYPLINNYAGRNARVFNQPAKKIGQARKIHPRTQSAGIRLSSFQRRGMR